MTGVIVVDTQVHRTSHRTFVGGEGREGRDETSFGKQKKKGERIRASARRCVDESVI